MARALPMAAMILVGCSHGQYTLVAELSGVTGAETVEIALIPSCAGQTLGAPPSSPTVHAIAHRAGAVMSTGTTQSGHFGLYALARNDACAIVGAGCVDVMLVAGGSGELVVPVMPATGPACTMVCDHGVCGTDVLDAGSTDAGSRDGGRIDAGPPIDSGPHDSGPPVDGGPTGDPPTRIRAADMRGTMEYCTCVTPGDFMTIPECMERLLPNPIVYDCRATAYSTDTSGLFTHFDCLAGVDETYATCLQAARCNSTVQGMCDDTFQMQSDMCPNASSAAQNGYDDAYWACIMMNLLGSAPDSCSDTVAASMATGDAVFSGTTVGAGFHRSLPDPCGNGPDGGADVTFRWSAPSAGMWTFDTAGSAFDSVMALFSDCTPGATRLACDDDGGPSQTSSITIALTAGQTVQITVQAFNPELGGRFVVNIHPG